MNNYQSVLDEFEFLLEEEPVETTHLEDSQILVEQAKRFLDKCNSNPEETYQGIRLSDFAKCISIGISAIIPWEHVTFTLNVNWLKDIANDKLEVFNIPSFVEELESIGDKDGTEFGYNQSGRNNLKTIFIPSSVIAIAPNTFAFYKKLENIKFENNCKLMYLGKQAFVGCESLHKIDLRNCIYLEDIQENTFMDSGIEILKIHNQINYNDSFKQALDNSNIKTVFICKEKVELNK